MLLDEEETKELVARIIGATKQLLAQTGERQRDPQTGFEHRECRIGPFVAIEHQRQHLDGGTVNTNGLDLWQIVDGKGRKLLSVNYFPYELKFFYKSGKLPWVKELFELAGLEQPLPLD